MVNIYLDKVAFYLFDQNNKYQAPDKKHDIHSIRISCIK